MTTLEMVAEFHQAFNVHEHSEPCIKDVAMNKLRWHLLNEELEELRIAMLNKDIIGTLDALCDLQYVLDGTYLALGMASIKDVAMAEVHRSNMSKLGDDGKPILRKDGKILKSENYSPPNLSQFFESPAA